MTTNTNIHGEPTTWLSCAETARLLRTALNKAFPDVKFSVRSKVYSGGASIRVAWTDGPLDADVQKVCDRFEGSDFDGMQDLKTNKHETRVDGYGEIRHVHYGSDFVFANRSVSRFDEWQDAALDMIRRRCTIVGAWGQERFGDEWIEQLAQRMARAVDFTSADPLEPAFQRHVMRNGI